jgi:hypothetical protein
MTFRLLRENFIYLLINVPPIYSFYPVEPARVQYYNIY